MTISTLIATLVQVAMTYGDWAVVLESDHPQFAWDVCSIRVDRGTKTVALSHELPPADAKVVSLEHSPDTP